VKRRSEKVKLKDAVNRQGKGLRNVKNGRIIFDTKSIGEHKGILENEDVIQIRKSTKSIFEELEDIKIAL
jgi:hypothetical protein